MLRARVLAALLAAFLLLAFAACSPRTAPGTPTEVPPSPTPTAPAPSPETATDALEAVIARVAELRGLPAPATVDVRFVARRDLPALLDSLITPEERELFGLVTALYRLLGHLGPEQDYLGVLQAFSSTAVLGLYSPDHDALWVVTETGDPLSPAELSAEEMETLVHEVLHAVQDAAFDLGASYREVMWDLDRSLAWTAVVEGDAVFHSGEYRRRYLLLPSESFVSWTLAGARSQIGDVPASIIRELYFPYTVGASWAEWIVDTLGQEGLDRFLAEPPPATSVIIHRELATRDWRPVEVSEPDLGAALGPEWERVWGGHFGEFQLRNLLQLGVDGEEARRAAAGWAGDAFALYSDGSRHLAAFDLHFERADDAAEAFRTLRAMLERRGTVTPTSETSLLARTADGREFAALARGPQVLMLVADAEGFTPVLLDVLASTSTP